MTNISPKIGWVKWKNPYAVDEDTKENDNYDCDIDELEETCDEHGYVPNKNMKIVLTPMGAVPLPEHSAPQKVFNLWMAHTNFNITNNILGLVEETDGVETVDVFTRYRMRIGICLLYTSPSPRDS